MIVIAIATGREMAEVVETSAREPRDTTAERKEGESATMIEVGVESARLEEMTASIDIETAITTKTESTIALIEATAPVHALPTRRQGNEEGRRAETGVKVAVVHPVAATVKIACQATIREASRRVPASRATEMKPEVTESQHLVTAPT